MRHGVGFDHFKMDEDFDAFVQTCYPKHAASLLQILPSLHTLDFLHQYSNFKTKLVQDVLKEMLYSFVLLIVGIGLSYFYIHQFEPSIYSLLNDFGVSAAALKKYKIIIQICLFVFNMFVALIIILLLLAQSKDLKIIITIYFLKYLKFAKQLISYQYAMMLLLFLQFDLKTSQMIQFLRISSIGDINKWLSYHVESSLDQGSDFANSLSLDYFDSMMVDFISLGSLHSDVNRYLKQYCDLMEKEVRLKMKQIGRFFKTIVFSYLILIVAIYYASLYLPLQLLEVL